MNQTNHGSGTFVAGNVLGSIVNLFMPAQRRARPAPPSGPEVAEDDYDDISGSLFGSAFLAAVSGQVVSYCVRGLPLFGTGPTPGLPTRFLAGFAFAYAFFACVAMFLARAAQGLEVWAGRCADIAVQTRVRPLAQLPASVARILAPASSGTATTAALVATFYAWGDFGGSVQERAYLARDGAAMNAARARAAVQRG
ncbi:hypothetical protein [Streptomyces sp. NBC_01264]|uniref:hypothetical protein n=1 Tax=Streptomyces sp. NBC_01264 TaxID=2903804 RepID=UPI0022574D71|nr:hypothetical protein [Streptomyces sp. NBC_01264]MCX4783072.1 hypothetical protein [Streptomyces sp. NBC_01264]